jgi:hypothetical protein
MKTKLKIGYYIAEAPATGNSMEDTRYVVFQWTKAEEGVVEMVRRQLKTMDIGVRWYSVRIGPGPRVQFLNYLPDWVDDVEGLREGLDGGTATGIGNEEAERLFSIEDDSVTRVDCVHLTITDSEVYVGAYGKHSGTHWETRDFSSGEGMLSC